MLEVSTCIFSISDTMAQQLCKQKALCKSPVCDTLEKILQANINNLSGHVKIGWMKVSEKDILIKI
jgi:hypothetical protein